MATTVCGAASTFSVERRGFTLVELLVVVALMSVLVGMMSVALAGARQDARVRRAEAEIAAITSILQYRMNEINLMPIAFQAADETSGPTGGGAVAAGVEQNRVAMLARRDLMRMTLPQCRADLIYPPARLQYLKTVRVGGATTSRACAVKIRQPAEWITMRRIAGFTNPAVVGPGLDLSSGVDPLTGPNGYYTNASTRSRLGAIRRGSDGSTHTIDLTNEPWGADLSADRNMPWSREHESAECLYLILASTEIFGERAIDQFHARSIANLDGDNVPEIIDPWGRPYEFIRDATGRGFPFFGRSVAYSLDSDNSPNASHPAGADANDYLRTDVRYLSTDSIDDPFRLNPLVVSAGSDGDFGIRRSFNPGGSVAGGTAGISPRQSIAAVRLSGMASPTTPVMPGSYQYPDPFAFVGDTDPTFEIPQASLGDRTILSWFRGMGLGAPLVDGAGRVDETSVDNIYSSGSPQ